MARSVGSAQWRAGSFSPPARGCRNQSACFLRNAGISIRPCRCSTAPPPSPTPVHARCAIRWVCSGLRSCVAARGPARRDVVDVADVAHRVTQADGFAATFGNEPKRDNGLVGSAQARSAQAIRHAQPCTVRLMSAGDRRCRPATSTCSLNLTARPSRPATSACSSIWKISWAARSIS